MTKFYEDSELSAMYEVFRPKYPVEIVAEVLKFLDEQNPGEKRRGFMLDVGCGGGQATRLFAPHFEKVLGIDQSVSQTEMGKKTVPNVEFRVGSANLLPVESESVDLIISGTAVHYFDFDAFFPECDRVLRPGGCVALFAHWPRALKTKQGEIIKNSTGDTGISGVFGKYEQEIGVNPFVTKVLMEHYQPIYDCINKMCKKIVKGIELDKTCTFDEFVGFFETVGEYRCHKDRFGDVDPLETAKSRIQKLLGLTNGNDAKESSFIATFGYPIVLFQE